MEKKPEVDSKRFIFESLKRGFVQMRDYLIQKAMMSKNGQQRSVIHPKLRGKLENWQRSQSGLEVASNAAAAEIPAVDYHPPPRSGGTAMGETNESTSSSKCFFSRFFLFSCVACTCI